MVFGGWKTTRSIYGLSHCNPQGMAFDAAGVMYLADQDNYVVRKVTPAGVISTVAGNGHQGFSGDGGPAISAALYDPSGVAVDSVGNLYIADFNNRRIRKVTPDGVISTVAGNGGMLGDSGDGGPATSAANARVAPLRWTYTSRPSGSFCTSGSSGPNTSDTSPTSSSMMACRVTMPAVPPGSLTGADGTG